MDVINWITANYESLFKILGMFYVAATAIATLTPTGKDDTFLEKVGYYADKIGLQLK